LAHGLVMGFSWSHAAQHHDAVVCEGSNDGAQQRRISSAWKTCSIFNALFAPLHGCRQQMCVCRATRRRQLVADRKWRAARPMGRSCVDSGSIITNAETSTVKGTTASAATTTFFAATTSVLSAQDRRRQEAPTSPDVLRRASSENADAAWREGRW
jgi:hypothetical protein